MPTFSFAAVVDRLEIGLKGPLPGAAAQALMAPRQKREWPAGSSPDRARDAAGLLLLVPHGPADGRPHIVLTERAHTLDRHGGQVSLPGGVVEPGETYDEAARREAHEEIGLASGAVVTLGALTPLDIPVSSFRLHPIVGVASARPPLHPSDGEVARILEVPLDDLLNPERIVWGSLTRAGVAIDFPAFPAAGALIWGATAMVLAELLAMLGWSGPKGA